MDEEDRVEIGPEMEGPVEVDEERGLRRPFLMHRLFFEFRFALLFSVFV